MTKVRKNSIKPINNLKLCLIFIFFQLRFSRSGKIIIDRYNQQNKMALNKMLFILLLTWIAYASIVIVDPPLNGSLNGPLNDPVNDTFHIFCWKDSYGRGIGSVPTDCGNRVKIGLLCYDSCPSGYSRYGFDCHQSCPSGFTDQGLFCRLLEYGRGAGYPWKFGDGLNDRGMFRRCEADHGAGNCQKSGAIVYPKCRSGYAPAGCCICRPSKPNCGALGMNQGIDLSCAKKIRIGTPYSAKCISGLQKSGSLCYKLCRDEYYGVGPVCWHKAPLSWVPCGMGAAKTDDDCATVIRGQIVSVAIMALNLALLALTDGAAAPALSSLEASLKDIKTAVKTANIAVKLGARAQSIIEKFSKKTNHTSQEVQENEQAINALDVLKELLGVGNSTLTMDDYARIGSSVASILDPTGIAGVMEAYSYSKCSHLFEQWDNPIIII